MIINSLMELYQSMRLLNYKTVFHGVREKSGSLSATEAFSADVINIMGEPTLTEFADEIGISQPNATYKVNSLVSKGYIEKVTYPNDRRETHLRMGKKFKDYYGDYNGALSKATADISTKFTQEEIETAAKVIEELNRQMKSQFEKEEK